MTRRPGRLVGLIGVAALAAAAACSRHNPAFFGAADGGAPQSDAHPSADGASQDAPAATDGTATTDGGCVPALPCVPEGDRCKIGTSVCTGDVKTCENLTPAPNGSFCGVDKVCKDGSCIDCAAGAACSTGTECEAGRLDCSMASGAPACVAAGTAADGSPCTGGVCYGGVCRTDTCGGLAGTTCDSSSVCDLNGCATDVVGVCVTKQTCAPLMPPYSPVCGCDGTTYLDDCRRLAAGVALAHAGACTGATEDCFNGVDDNGDGLTDCADPQCQAVAVCAATPPLGWTSVGWIDPDTLVTCPTDTTTQDLYEAGTISAPALTCQCECGTPSVNCAVSLTCFGSDSTCGNGSGNVVNAYATACHSLSLPQGSSGCKAGEPHIVGACAATLKTTRPTVSWSPTGRACTLDAGGTCSDAGQICVPRPPQDAIGPCIVRSGDYACPAAPYNVKHLYYTGQPADGRSCSACPSTCTVSGTCTCDSGVPECGAGIYSDTACSSSTPQVVPPTNVCTPVSISGSVVTTEAVGVLGPTGTQCIAPTSTANGSMGLGPKLTVCCAQ